MKRVDQSQITSEKSNYTDVSNVLVLLQSE